MGGLKLNKKLELYLEAMRGPQRFESFLENIGKGLILTLMPTNLTLKFWAGCLLGQVPITPQSAPCDAVCRAIFHSVFNFSLTVTVRPPPSPQSMGIHNQRFYFSRASSEEYAVIIWKTIRLDPYLTPYGRINS